LANNILDLLKNKLILIILSLLLWVLFIKLSVHPDYSSLLIESLVSLFVFSLFLIHFYFASLRLKLLMILIVPLSYFGELLFSSWLGLYEYNLGRVPFYIPIGHGVVFGTAVELNQIKKLRDFVISHKTSIYFLYIISFLTVIIYFRDTLSLLFGIVMLITLVKKNKHTLYLIVGIVVLYLELVGTYFGCWNWKQDLSIFHTTNPPLGSIFIYIGGDILLNRILRKFLNFRSKI
jgi:hypothetical protein